MNDVHLCEHVASPNEISARLATALKLGYQQQQEQKTDSTMNATMDGTALDHVRLDRLSPVIDQEQLQQQQSTKTHVDFICLLPYEIVSSILELLTTDELLEYMDVSRGWRELITSFPTLWHELSITHGNYGVLFKLPFIGTYIWKYTIHNGNARAINGSLERMRSGYLNNIQSLTWENCICTHRNILDSVSYLKDTLTELTLKANWETAEQPDAYTLPSLSSILTACPGLKRLNVAFSTRIIQIPESTQHALPRDLELTHLNWTTPFRPDDSEVQAVLDACPKLQYLQVGGYEASAPVLTIRKRYPNLRYISLGDMEAYGPDMGFWDDEKVGEEQQQPGLRALAMPCTNDHAWVDLQELLGLDSKGLKKLSLYCGNDFSVDADYLIRHFNGDYLNLHRTYAAWNNRAQVDAIITATEDINMMELARKYTITSTFEMGDERGVLGFINALRTGTTALAHTVSRLRFWNCPGSAILLPLLLDLPCRLQVLQFENCEFSTSILVGFLRSLKTSPWPTLQELGFISIPSFTDDVVAEIAGIPGLRRVVLWRCDDVTDQGVRSLLEEYSDLQDIDIGECSQVTDQAVRYVKDKLDASKCTTLSSEDY